jgi:hypothetical protein
VRRGATNATGYRWSGCRDRPASRTAEILHLPRLRPEYHPTYYAVFLRDLDGNNVEAVCHV